MSAKTKSELIEKWTSRVEEMGCVDHALFRGGVAAIRDCIRELEALPDPRPLPWRKGPALGGEMPEDMAIVMAAVLNDLGKQTVVIGNRDYATFHDAFGESLDVYELRFWLPIEEINATLPEVTE